MPAAAGRHGIDWWLRRSRALRPAVPRTIDSRSARRPAPGCRAPQPQTGHARSSAARPVGASSQAGSSSVGAPARPTRLVGRARRTGLRAARSACAARRETSYPAGVALLLPYTYLLSATDHRSTRALGAAAGHIIV